MESGKYSMTIGKITIMSNGTTAAIAAIMSVIAMPVFAIGALTTGKLYVVLLPVAVFFLFGNKIRVNQNDPQTEDKEREKAMYKKRIGERLFYKVKTDVPNNALSGMSIDSAIVEEGKCVFLGTKMHVDINKIDEKSFPRFCEKCGQKLIQKKNKYSFDCGFDTITGEQKQKGFEEILLECPSRNDDEYSIVLRRISGGNWYAYEFWQEG